jgi:tRNA pseudouridine38-40 synthase
MNFRLTLQYDGTDFHGWQVQSGNGNNQRTVQGELMRALELIEGRSVVVHGAGRTDAGVHAAAQVASVQLQREMTAGKLRAAINGNVGRDLRVTDARIVGDDFHARYSARGKTYHYRIFNAPFMSPFRARYALHAARPLDVERMQEAAQLFIGEHDWTAFSAAQSDVASRVRCVTEMRVTKRWSERGQGTLIEIAAGAEGFLRYMVRSIAGTLLAAGRGGMDLKTIERAIQSGERSLVGATAPAHGLTLARVRYDD